MGGVFSFFCGCLSHFKPKNDRLPLSIRSNRSMTDKLCLILFLVAFAGIIAILIIAQNNGGNPYKLIRPVDLRGRMCGEKGSAVESAPFGAMPNPFSAFGTFVCVSDCAHTNRDTSTDMAILHPSSEFLRYCVPFGNTVFNSTLLSSLSAYSSFNSNSQLVTRSIGDLFTASNLLIGCCFIALGISLFYLIFLRMFAGLLIWVSLIASVLAGFLLGYSFLKAAADSSEDTEGADRIKAYRVMGYICLALSGLFTLIIIALRKRIQIAIEVIKLSAHALGDMKTILIVPVIPLAFALLYFALWIYIALYIFSVNTETYTPTPVSLTKKLFGFPLAQIGSDNDLATTAPNTVDLNFDIRYRPLAAYHIFHLFWTSQFFLYLGYMIISGAVANWYFTAWNDSQSGKLRGTGPNELAPAPVLRALYRTIRYHLGTVGFAALIIAIIQMARATLRYIEKKTRGNPPNILQKAIFCCLQCFLCCLECCLDKINKNALIWTCIWGDSFLPSACSAFSLIWRNLFRVAALAGVEAILFFLGKIAITLATTGIGAIILNLYFKDRIQSSFFVCIVIFFFAYVVASVFFLIFETVVDTTFFCFLVDSENAEHEHVPMCAHKELASLVGKYSATSKTLAAESGANEEPVKVGKTVELHTKVVPHTGK